MMNVRKLDKVNCEVNASFLINLQNIVRNFSERVLRLRTVYVLSLPLRCCIASTYEVRHPHYTDTRKTLHYCLPQVRDPD